MSASTSSLQSRLDRTLILARAQRSAHKASKHLWREAFHITAELLKRDTPHKQRTAKTLPLFERAA